MGGGVEQVEIRRTINSSRGRPAIGSPVHLNAGIDITLLQALREVGPGLPGELALSLLMGKRRSLAEDARRVTARITPPPRVEGLQRVPSRAPFLLAANHFQAPDHWIGLVAATISAAVATVRAPESRDLHWVVISEWRSFEFDGAWVPNPLSSLIFPRACRMWGLIPMPARPSDVAGRARALRQVLACLGVGRGTAAPEPVALFPEGTASFALEEARPGSGAFLHRVSILEIPLLPVGAYVEEGTLVVSFGELFSLPAAPPAGEDLDVWARRQVMVAIGRLLPRELWGAYADAIEDRRGPS